MEPCSHQRHTYPANKMIPKSEAHYWRYKDIEHRKSVVRAKRDNKKFHTRKSRMFLKEELVNELRFV